MRPPRRQPLSFPLLLRKLKWALRVLYEWTTHTVAFFEEMPNGIELTASRPGGTISEEMLPVCQQLASDADARLRKLEAKATGLLSLIAIVIPLTASAAVFIRQNGLSAIPGAVTLGLNLAAILVFLLALVAALRAVAVRGTSALFLGTVIDPASDQVRDYCTDFYGRGILHVAATRQAICDHIALFVRAAQLFLVLGMLLAASAAVPALFYVRADAPAIIQGTVTIEPESLRAIRGAVREAAAMSDTEIARLESEIRLVRDAKDHVTRADIERLAKEVAGLRKQIQAQRPIKPTTK